MDIVVFVRNKGFSGLRELVEHLLKNLNFRSWDITDYTPPGLWTFGSSKNIKVNSAVANTEIEKYLQVFFGLSVEDSQEALVNLIELGFLKISYYRSNSSPKWVHDAGWGCLVSSNLQ